MRDSLQVRGTVNLKTEHRVSSTDQMTFGEKSRVYLSNAFGDFQVLNRQRSMLVVPAKVKIARNPTAVRERACEDV